MDLSINFNSIKNSIITTYHTVANRTSEWMGRIVTIVKSGAQRTLPYLQDRPIAAVSLIAVNLILLEIGAFFGKWAIYYMPTTSLDEMVILYGSALAGTVIVGVSLFAKNTNLPFSNTTIVAISVLSTLVGYMMGFGSLE